MAWRVTWHLECDHCGEKGTFKGAPSSAVEKKAIQKKWTFIRDAYGLIRHLCPVCGADEVIRDMYSD